MWGYRALCCRIICRALLDVKPIAPITERKIAMDFFSSDYCESMCDFAGIDYRKVLEKAGLLYGNRGDKSGCSKTI
jgi:hypothetical protein